MPAGAENNNFLGAGVDVSLTLCLGAIETGAFQHYVYVKSLPRKVNSLGFGIDGYLFASTVMEPGVTTVLPSSA